MSELPHHYIALLLGDIRSVMGEITLNLTSIDKKADARILLDVMKDDDELFLPVWREDYLFCMNKNHPLARKKNIEPTDLNNEIFIICPPCEVHQRTLGQLSQKNLSVKIVAKTETKHQVAMLLLANDGVSFLPKGMAREWPELIIPLPVSNIRYEHGFSGSETRRSDES